MVTRTQKMLVRECLVYDETSGSNIEQVFTAKETDKKWKDKISEMGYVFLKLLSEEKVTYKLSMSDDLFFQMANVEVIDSNSKEINNDTKTNE